MIMKALRKIVPVSEFSIYEHCTLQRGIAFTVCQLCDSKILYAMLVRNAHWGTLRCRKRSRTGCTTSQTRRHK
jgi:hypothetical protein